MKDASSTMLHMQRNNYSKTKINLSALRVPRLKDKSRSPGASKTIARDNSSGSAEKEAFVRNTSVL